MKNTAWSKQIAGVPTKIVTGKVKKKVYYVSYNAIFSTPHHSIRAKLVNGMKDFIKPFLSDMPHYSVPVSVDITYFSKRSQFDLDNKCGIWCKIFLDTAKMNKLTDDNVKWVTRIAYSYEKLQDGEDEMIITITPNKK